jgi:hypothetical protein
MERSRRSNTIITPGVIIEELAGNELEDQKSKSSSPVRKSILRSAPRSPPLPVRRRPMLRSVPRPAVKAAPKKPVPPEPLTASEIVDNINYAISLNPPPAPAGVAVQYCFLPKPHLHIMSFF